MAEVTTDAEGVKTVTGLTGRTLTIPTGWSNPSGVWRCGVKAAWDLYPRGVRERMVAERQERDWDPAHKRCQAEAVSRQQQAEQEKEGRDPDTLSLVEKLQRENAEAEVEMAASLDKKFKVSRPRNNRVFVCCWGMDMVGSRM